jgi:hypothetical protein
MPSANTPDPGPPFDAGRALALSFSILASNAGALALMTVLIQLPSLAYQLVSIVKHPIEPPAEPLAPGALPTDAMLRAAVHAQQHTAILTGVAMFFTALATTAVIYRIFQQIQGKPGGFGDSLRFGVRRMGAILLIDFLTRILTFLGGLAFIVPGVIVATALFVAAPVAVAEGRGVIDSLRRSADLTRGSRWGIFGLMIMPAALMVGLNLAALLAGGEVKPEIAIANPRFQAVNVVLTVLYQALTAVTTTVAYLELRRREGLPTARTAGTPA